MPVNFTFTNPGTFTIEDDGVRGNGVSVIRNSAGAVVFVITHPADSVNLTVSTPGVNLIFNVLDSFGLATVTVGNLASAAASPDSIVVRHLRSENLVTLVSNGSITEGGNDAAADLVVNSLIMSAVTGIGTPANAIETQTLLIEAETNDGGINVANFGNLQIGGLTAAVDGLDVANSGDLNVATIGFMLLNDASGPEMVHGGDLSGNVTLTALGDDSSLFVNLNRPAITAPGGGITVTAGQDVAFGSGGMNFNNDVLATTFVTIQAGRDFLLDGQSNIRTGAFGGVVGGPILVQTGRNIVLSNTNGGLQSIEAFLGNVTLTTGPGGAYIQNAAFPAAVMTSGDIFLNADVVLLASGGLNTTGIGSVTIRPVTPGRAIDLGSAVDLSGALSLSEAELDRLFTLNINIGDAESGPVEFSAPISPNLFPISLVVRSATEILVRSSITLDASLTLIAGDDLFFTAAGSFTSSSSAGSFTGFVDQAQDDGGAGGVGNLGGTISVATSILLVGNADNDTLSGNGAANTLLGEGGNDTLSGLGGNDTLDGGTGTDVLAGGLGDDVFFVDTAADVVTEATGEGNDRVAAAVGYVLPAGASVETLETVAQAATDPINLTGNALAQSIVGNDGNNMLTGGGGSDTMTGLGGNDTFIGNAGANSTMNGNLGDDVFFVFHASDTVVEAVGEGNDRVAAALSYVLTAGSSVETLETTNLGGTGAINLTGNIRNQMIVGNNGDNMLTGGGGNDHLIGAGGQDTLIGSSSASTLDGGAGSDTYFVMDGSDMVIEASGGGSDRIAASVSYTLAPGAEVETLEAAMLASTSALDFTGNVFQNLLVGNNGANVLDGKGGMDTLNGAGGADTFAFTTALATNNIDTILGFATGTDKIGLDDAIFTAVAPGALTAGAFVVAASAQDADDRIIYNPATGALLYDPDGIGAAAAVQFATLSGGPTLVGSDFVLI